MTFLCQTCGKNFGSKAKLNTHKQIHSEKVLICKICDKTLIGIKSFNNHIKIHQTYECTICESTIKLNSKTAHMKLCSNVESKKFTCNECPYVVDRQDRLKTHQEKKHSKSVTSRFQCTYCQKFKVTRKIGTPVHKELALKSLVWHNSKRAGYVSPAEFRLRTSSPRSSPLSSPRVELFKNTF